MPTPVTSKTTTKKDLINSIALKTDEHPDKVRQVVQLFLDQMTDILVSGGRLEFRDFGVFEIVHRKQKIGRNPRKAADPIVIPARNAVKFTAGKKMRKNIADKERHGGKKEARNKELSLTR